MANVPFAPVPGGSGAHIAESHGHAEQDLRNGLATALGGNKNRADLSKLQEVFYSEQHGFGHDCSLHQEVDQSLWSPGCGTFRAVTVATDIPSEQAVERKRAPNGG